MGEPPEGRSPETILGEYRARGIGQRLGFGRRPAVVIVDFILGFTDPESPLGSELGRELAATRRLVQRARRRRIPVLFAVTAYDASLADGGLFVVKVPALGILRRGERWTSIDPVLGPEEGETVIEKQYASAFFGTSLASTLTALGVDTVLLAGCTTSGCIRATAVDALQHGFRAVVPRECVGDRAPEPHEASLLDIEGKYGDVVELEAALEYLDSLDS